MYPTNFYSAPVGRGMKKAPFRMLFFVILLDLSTSGKWYIPLLKAALRMTTPLMYCENNYSSHVNPTDIANIVKKVRTARVFTLNGLIMLEKRTFPPMATIVIKSNIKKFLNADNGVGGESSIIIRSFLIGL